jgi:hypothetical protein
MMSYSKNEIYEILLKIYLKHKKKYKNPPKTKSMACMWSIMNPPDIIEDTPPFHDIENAFDIEIDIDDCYEIYDMELDEATEKIEDIIKNQC